MKEIPIIPSRVPEDFTKMWLTYMEGKAIIDIGADNGDTASFFLKHGARFVYCIEGNPEHYANLLNNSKSFDYAISTHLKMINNPMDMAECLDYPAEIVKIDIEGAEINLLPLSAEVILQHDVYMIEFHWHKLETEIKQKFRELGFSCEDKLYDKIGYAIAYNVSHFTRRR